MRKMLRRKIGSYTWALLIYYGIMNIAVFAVTELVLVYEGLQAVASSGSWMDFATGMENAMESVMSNGWGYLLSCAVAVLGIRLWKGKAFWQDMHRPKQAMTWRGFGSLAVLLVSAQLVFQALAFVMELLLNLLGLSLMESIAMASAGADTLSMFLYLSLGAPIVEELIFRGLILRGLEPYGKRFAIVASAVLFGLFHGNLAQSPYAFCVGLLLGYTAMEHSIGWSMVLHMLNNLVLGDMLTRLTSGMGSGADLIFSAIVYSCAVAAVVILVLNRRQIRAYRRSDPIDREANRAFWTALPNILFVLLMLANAIAMLFMA